MPGHLVDVPGIKTGNVMIQQQQQSSAKKVLARTKEITPGKLVKILSGLCDANAHHHSNFQRREAISCIRYALQSCKYSQDDMAIVRTCLSLERHFYTISPSTASKSYKKYTTKVNGIMQACRAFIGGPCA